MLTWRENLQRPAASSPPFAIPVVNVMAMVAHGTTAAPFSIFRAPAATFGAGISPMAPKFAAKVARGRQVFHFHPLIRSLLRNGVAAEG